MSIGQSLADQRVGDLKSVSCKEGSLATNNATIMTSGLGSNDLGRVKMYRDEVQYSSDRQQICTIVLQLLTLYGGRPSQACRSDDPEDAIRLL